MSNRLPRLARFLILAAVALSGYAATPAAASTPVPAPVVAPVAIEAAGCWVESDGEPMSGPLSLMPVDAGTVDCRDLPGWYTDDSGVDALDAVTVVRSNDDGSITLTLVNEDVTGDVWDTLISLGYRGDPADGCECLTVDANTVIDGAQGSYVITQFGVARY